MSHQQARDPDSQRWIKLYMRALRPGSSLMKLSEANRWRFLVYVLHARWQKPFRGCLCDEDGRPWSREERARLLGVSYAAAKRAEEEMLEAGLITFQRAHGHPEAVGRLHIANYARYQGGDGETEDEVYPGEPYASEGNPSSAKGEPYASEGNPSSAKGEPYASEGKTLRQRRDDPTSAKGLNCEAEPYVGEGSTAENPRETTARDGSTFCDEPYASEGGLARARVNRKRPEERQEERLNDEVISKSSVYGAHLSTLSTPRPPASAPREQHNDNTHDAVDPSDQHILLLEYGEIRTLLQDLRGDVFTQRDIQRWTVDLARAIKDEHTPLDEPTVMQALRDDVPDVAIHPKAWLSRQIARLREPARDSPRQARRRRYMPPMKPDELQKEGLIPWT